MRSPDSCPACHTEPASHRTLWIASTGDIVTQAVPLHKMPFYRFFNRVGELFMSILGRVFFELGRVLGIITLTSDVGTAINRRSRLLWLAAQARGLEMEQILFFGTPTDSFRVLLDGHSHFFKSLPLTPPSETLRMDDKFLFKRTLRAAGLPVPQSRSASNYADAKRALNELGIVCVKPRSGSNGRHTYPHVTTEDELRAALESAKQICAFASVEENLEGSLCRATCVGGSMIGFLECQYPTVVGDGISTVVELIEKQNAEKPEGVGDIVLSSMHLGYIARRGYGPESVLPAGVALPLTYRAGAASGGSNREHGRNIHPLFIEPIERAARLTGLHIVGFDLIIPDPQQPADGQRWGFVEANSLPWIDLHAGPFSGEPIDLSPYVWDLWEVSRRGSGTR